MYTNNYAFGDIEVNKLRNVTILIAILLISTGLAIPAAADSKVSGWLDSFSKSVTSFNGALFGITGAMSAMARFGPSALRVFW